DGDTEVTWDAGSRVMAYAPSRYQVEIQESISGQALATLEAPDGLQAIMMAFTPGGDRLAVWSAMPSHIRLWDLRLLRRRLAEMGLDWEMQQYELAAPNADSAFRVEVDLGELAEKK